MPKTETELKKAAIWGLVILVVVLAAVPTLFFLKTAPPLGFDGSHVWAHRGLHIEYAENSRESISAAFAAGATGIETDIRYIADRDRFIIAHDLPADPNDPELTTLSEILPLLPPHGFAWLDFKNLTTDISEAAGERLRLLLDRNDVRNRVFVESQIGPALRRLARREIKTIYWIRNKPSSIGMLAPRHITFMWNILISDYAAISAPKGALSESFLRVYGRFPIFTFTANDPAAIDAMLADGRIRVVLTDLDYFPR